MPGLAHVSCEIPNLRCNMDCERPEFPRQLLAGDIDERVSLEQPAQTGGEHRDQDNRKVPYTCAGAETRPGGEEAPYSIRLVSGLVTLISVTTLRLRL